MDKLYKAEDIDATKLTEAIANTCNCVYADGYNQALEDCCSVLRQCWLNGTVANRIVKEQIAEIEKLKR